MVSVLDLGGVMLVVAGRGNVMVPCVLSLVRKGIGLGALWDILKV